MKYSRKNKLWLIKCYNLTYLSIFLIINSEPLRSSTPYKQQYSKHEEHRYGSLNRSKMPGASEVISTYETSTTNGEPLGETFCIEN